MGGGECLCARVCKGEKVCVHVCEYEIEADTYPSSSRIEEIQTKNTVLPKNSLGKINDYDKSITKINSLCKILLLTHILRDAYMRSLIERT